MTGRIKVQKCRHCGHVKGFNFVPYKRRGRPKGSVNRKRLKGIKTLDKFGMKEKRRKHDKGTKTGKRLLERNGEKEKKEEEEVNGNQNE